MNDRMQVRFAPEPTPPDLAIVQAEVAAMREAMAEFEEAYGLKVASMLLPVFIVQDVLASLAVPPVEDVVYDTLRSVGATMQDAQVNAMGAVAGWDDADEAALDLAQTRGQQVADHAVKVPTSEIIALALEFIERVTDAPQGEDHEG